MNSVVVRPSSIRLQSLILNKHRIQLLFQSLLTRLNFNANDENRNCAQCFHFSFKEINYSKIFHVLFVFSKWQNVLEYTAMCSLSLIDVICFTTIVKGIGKFHRCFITEVAWIYFNNNSEKKFACFFCWCSLMQ